MGSPTLSDLVVDAANVYVSEVTGDILSVPAGGGSSIMLAHAAPAATIGPLVPSIRLALDGSNLYWIDTNKIAKVPVAGGATTQVVAFSSALDSTASMAVDTVVLPAPNVYWTEPTALDIRKSPK